MYKRQILDLGDGDVVSSDSAEVSPAGGDGEEVPGTVQSLSLIHI